MGTGLEETWELVYNGRGMKSKTLGLAGRFFRLFPAALAQYTNIGGQAVIEGVMMRSPHSFVVAVRKPDGKIRIRRDQWFGLGKKFNIFKKPFLRGVLVLIESMANGVVALNYSANIAMEEELRKKAAKKGKTYEEYQKEAKEKEKVNATVFLTVFISFLFGLALFVFLPHTLTLVLEKLLGVTWGLDSFLFHGVDGLFKAIIFLCYIWLIGFLPDVKRVFQYHGAEHKSISTFEAQEPLSVKNARKFTTLHPRCGTSFIFFLMFISIIIFSIIFGVFPLGKSLPYILTHVVAVLFKILLMFPVAGIAYEIIKWAGKFPNNIFCKTMSFPGMMLQKLTTKEPDDSQLEVALASIKTALLLEEKYNLKSEKTRVMSLEEIDVEGLLDIQDSSQRLEHFLEN